MKKLFTLFTFIFLVVLFAGNASAQLTLTVTVTNATNCTPPCNGTASVPVLAGATYSWNTTPVQTTPTATGLCPGTYSCTATYSVVLTAGGSGTVGCGANGVSTISVDENISVFPNPAHNELYLQINTSLQGKVDFTIRNILGTAVYQEAIETNGSLYKWVDISALPAGMYDVEFVHGTIITRQKFIKQ